MASVFLLLFIRPRATLSLLAVRLVEASQPELVGVFWVAFKHRQLSSNLFKRLMYPRIGGFQEAGELVSSSSQNSASSSGQFHQNPDFCLVLAWWSWF
jgi:hypothetical protein